VFVLVFCQFLFDFQLSWNNVLWKNIFTL
jgi:hypothetical protein